MSDCKLTGSFGYLVQLMLFGIAFLSLVYKRQNEKPKRQLKIWGLVINDRLIHILIHILIYILVGSTLAHFLNILLAIIITQESSNSDECQQYFITFMLDTTLGVLICYFLLRAVDNHFEKKNLHNYKTGNYLVAIVLKDESLQSINSQKTNESINRDHEQQYGKLGSFIKIDIKIWFIQLLIWNLIVIVSKIILFICQEFFKIFFVRITKQLFRPFQNYPNIELFLTMLFIPVTMNIFYFWVVDNFLKKQEITKIEQQLGFGKQLYIQNQQSIQLV